ncbi:MAG TPA: TRAP transporter substrate-binding protein [Rhodopila sp.]|uniref:TRAP transporter substrate-binding protein n=1 Tax=Rhodopila sp. TaxID=2480087 RepID=UPI002C4B699F|nr:TRAP transporter substrate-binding protein [Rhodopila sp.]HVY15106.1 TRAP transporter substrate-binding protein [Rhodopila sp.]
MRFVTSRRGLVRASGGLAAILATGKAPAFAQAKPVKMDIASATAVPDSGAVALDWMAKALNERSKGELDVTFHGATLLTKEIDIMNAVKSGNVAIGNAAGATATVFPEMGAFLVGYLITSYDQAYSILNGKTGDDLNKQFEQKYGVRVLYYFDYGFRHFWNSRHQIATPHDLRGLKIRVQPAKVFADTINDLGGIAVPLGWAEVITAAQQGVIDGADLPVVNMVPDKAYEVSKYYSLTAHNYASSIIGINARIFNGLTPAMQKLMLDTAQEAQAMVRHITETADTLDNAKKELESKGMQVVMPDRAPFIALAKKKLWPQYEKQYSGLWEQIVATKA